MRFAIAVIAVVTTTELARADAGPEREDVELRYAAPVACPDRAAVEEQIGERAPAARFVDGARRVFAITVTASATGYTGALAVTGSDAADRELSAVRCDDLVGALALVVALAIDPDGPGPEPAPEPAPAPAPRVAAVVPASVAVVGSAPEPRGRWSVDAALTGVVAGGVTPGALFGGAVEARLVRRGLGHLDVAALAGYDRAETDQGTSRFTFVAGRVSVCRRVLRAVETDACAHLEAGALVAHGDDIVNAQGTARLWLAPGAHLAARISLVAKVFAEIQLGLSVPVVRHHFYFNPDVTIARTGAVVPWLGIGVGARFP